ECDLLERLAAEKQFGLSAEEMDSILDPSLYIGRCPQQVTAFLEKVRPLLEGLDAEAVEINV
ncbi:MAG: adenylosuccinate lyase, partial [Firmicutes bacterium]|nr:adenylosuccinate lyase [Bacillota bacterium]